MDIDDDLKEYVTNYRLNLYDCQEHDTFDEYQTGLRQIFETTRYAKDKEKLKEIMAENSEAYSKIDNETKDMLEIVANVKIPEKFKTVEDGKERYHIGRSCIGNISRKVCEFVIMALLTENKTVNQELMLFCMLRFFRQKFNHELNLKILVSN